MKISGKTRLALLIGIGLLSGNVIRQRYFPTPLMPSRFIQAGHDVDAIAFSSDGSAFLASQYYRAGEMSLWSSTSKKRLHQWPVDAIKVWLSPDGRRSLNTKPNYKNDTTVCTLRDTSNGKVIRSWQIEGSTSAVSRDRTMLVSVKYVHRKNNKRQAIIYLNDVGSGRVRSRYLADDPYGSYIAFSRDGQYILLFPRLKARLSCCACAI